MFEEEEEMEETEPLFRRAKTVYQRGGFCVKDQKRVQQLERHDRQARACYQAIEHEIERLKIIIQRLRNGEHLTQCR